MYSGARAGSVGRYLSGLSMQDERRSAVSQRLFVRACFECRAETAWGDMVAICGSSEQLGSWRPERALRMATDEVIYPIWRCEPLLLCSDDVEFKFIILRGDGSIEWEPLVHNRRLALGTAMDDVQVVAEFGAAAGWPAPPVPSPMAPSPLIGRNHAPGGGHGGGPASGMMMDGGGYCSMSNSNGSLGVGDGYGSYEGAMGVVGGGAAARAALAHDEHSVPLAAAPAGRGRSCGGGGAGVERGILGALGIRPRRVRALEPPREQQRRPRRQCLRRRRRRRRW